MVIVLLLVTMIVFGLIHLLPGDPVLIYMTSQDMNSLTQAQLQQTRHELGLDKPMPVLYVEWLGGVVRGNFGNSIIRQTPVMKDLKQRFPITAYLGVIALAFSTIIGIPAGVIAAIRRGGWLDQVITAIGNLGITAPSFWVAIFLIYIFGLKLNWFPVYGYVSPFTNFTENITHSILPIFCLAIAPIAMDMRLTRSSMLEVMHQDYIRTAWSKGLKEKSVVIRHALKNGLIPVVTMKGMGVIMIFGGSVFIETVFAIPGMGTLLVNGVRSLDYPVVQGVIFVMAIIVMLVNLLIDVSWGWLDPRIRY